MQYDFNLLPGQSQNIDVKGRFFKYKAGNGIIRVRTSLGGAVDLLPGQGVEDVEFSGLTVSNRSTAANAGSILAGDFKYTDDRITGTVDVVDGGKSRTLANVAMVMAVNLLSDATSAPTVYLQNPADSGKIIVVKTLTISTAAAQAYGACWIGSVTGADATALSIVSKSQQGAFAAKVFKHETGARAVATQGSFATDALPDNGRAVTVFQEPLVIRPGMQMMVFGTKLASNIIVVMECIEEAI